MFFRCEKEVPKFNGATILRIALLCVGTECRERNRAPLEDGAEGWDSHIAYPGRKAFIEGGFAMLQIQQKRNIKKDQSLNSTSIKIFWLCIDT
jgi:hypothetical protein